MNEYNTILARNTYEAMTTNASMNNISSFSELYKFNFEQ